MIIGYEILVRKLKKTKFLLERNHKSGNRFCDKDARKNNKLKHVGDSKNCKRALSLPGAFLGAALLSQSALSMQVNNADSYDFEHISCLGEPYEIRIFVTNVKKAEGQIVVDLYRNDPETFLRSEGQVLQKKYAAKKGTTQFCITAPGPDEYAVGLYHDKNANSKLDKGALGIPSEYWGVSLDTKKRFKAPPIEKTLFDLTEDGYNLTIKLRKR